MPRGGRRPGAGARKGNTNALKSINNSPRARMVYEVISVYPDKQALGQILIDNGLSLPRKFTPADTRRAVAIFYNHFFDRTTPNDQNDQPQPTIRKNQTRNQSTSKQIAKHNPSPDCFT